MTSYLVNTWCELLLCGNAFTHAGREIRVLTYHMYLYFNILGMRNCNNITLEGSLSVVSKPIFAIEYTFCSTFWDQILQDLRTLAPLQTKESKFTNVSPKLWYILVNFCKTWPHVAKCRSQFGRFCVKFRYTMIITLIICLYLDILSCWYIYTF